MAVSCLAADSSAVEITGQPIELTTQDDYFMAPEWSPDGRTIAVSGQNYAGIYLISFPAGDITTLTNDPAVGFGIQWSHRGDRIAARPARFEDEIRYNAVAVYDVDTKVRTVVTEFATLLPGTPRWTRDDQFIFLNGSDRFRIHAAHEVDMKSERISPPPEKVIFVEKERIKVRDLASEVEYAMDVVEGRILNLAISPENTMMAFEVMGGNLWVSDVQGESLVDFGEGHNPAWDPSGRRITYSVTEDDGHNFLSSDIFVINADGTSRVNVTATPDVLEMHPSWSPDGRRIAYDTVERGQIFLLQILQ